MLTKEERAKHWSNGAEDYDWYIKQELSGFKADWWYELIVPNRLRGGYILFIFLISL